MAHKILFKPTFILTLRLIRTTAGCHNNSHHPFFFRSPLSSSFLNLNTPPISLHSTTITTRTTNPTTTTTATSVDGYGGYLELTDDELMRQCEMGTFKSSGPGGQHRNKRESSVRLKHLPTGIISQASEDRSQHKNRASALNRLRSLIALKGKRWILKRIHHLESFFRYFLPSHPLEGQRLVHKLDPITQNLQWECKLFWILFLQLRDPSRMLQNILGYLPEHCLG